MRHIAVNYLLDDEDEERLRKITESYNAQGDNFSEDSVFESIMRTGSKYNIDDKFKFHERSLGLREKYTAFGIEEQKEEKQENQIATWMRKSGR